LGPSVSVSFPNSCAPPRACLSPALRRRQYFDDKVREWNPNASLYSGSLDNCGFPGSPDGPGFPRRASCFHEDFSGGLVSERLKVAQTKTCCGEVR
jgi:hypothetical protein